MSRRATRSWSDPFLPALDLRPDVPGRCRTIGRHDGEPAFALVLGELALALLWVRVPGPAMDEDPALVRRERGPGFVDIEVRRGGQGRVAAAVRLDEVYPERARRRACRVADDPVVGNQRAIRRPGAARVLPVGTRWPGDRTGGSSGEGRCRGPEWSPHRWRHRNPSLERAARPRPAVATRTLRSEQSLRVRSSWSATRRGTRLTAPDGHRRRRQTQWPRLSGRHAACALPVDGINASSRLPDPSARAAMKWSCPGIVVTYVQNHWPSGDHDGELWSPTSPTSSRPDVSIASRM